MRHTLACLLAVAVALVALATVPASAQNTGSVAVTVQNATNTNAIAGATVILMHRVGTGPNPTIVPVDTALTNAQGRVVFTGLTASDRYSAVAQAAGFVAGTSGNTTVIANDTMELTVALDPVNEVGAVGGTVRVQTALTPIAGAQVVVGYTSGGILIDMGSATTNAQGAYTIVGLPVRANYVVRVSASSYAPDTLTAVDVVANDTATANFLLVLAAPNTTTILGVVRDSSDNGPVAGAAVVLREGVRTGGGGGTITWTPLSSTTTNAQGSYVFGTLAPTTSTYLYSIVVSAAGFDTLTSAEITVAQNDTTILNVALTPASVVIAAAGGASAASARLTQVGRSLHLSGPGTLVAMALNGSVVVRASFGSAGGAVCLPEWTAGQTIVARVQNGSSEVSRVLPIR